MASQLDLLINQKLDSSFLSTEVQKALPSTLQSERFIRTLKSAIKNDQKLKECHPDSFRSAVMECAQLGLDPNPKLGKVSLIPRKNFKKNITEVSVEIGFKGFIELADRSNKGICHGVVKENDSFNFQLGTDQFLNHIPNLRGERGKTFAYWAVGIWGNNKKLIVIMSIDEVNSIRNNSDNYKSAIKFNTVEKSVWHKYPDEMGIKTVIKRLCKYLPLNTEIQSAIANVEEKAVFDGEYSNELEPEEKTITQETTESIDEETGEITLQEDEWEEAVVVTAPPLMNTESALNELKKAIK